MDFSALLATAKPANAARLLALAAAVEGVQAGADELARYRASVVAAAGPHSLPSPFELRLPVPFQRDLTLLIANWVPMARSTANQ